MSTTARNAGLFSVGLSSLTFISLAIYMPTFLQNMQKVNEMLKVRSDEFKAIADEAWEDLIDVKSIPAHLRAPRQSSAKNRNLRKAYPLPDTFVIPEKNSQTCTCQANNNCLPGPMGNSGRPGEDGVPGNRGEPGPIGIVGIIPPIEVRGPSCRPCPSGPRGSAGNQGESGPIGPDGAPGAKGQTGLAGREGYIGNPDNVPGETGKAGKPGEQGSPGLEGVRGEKGIKGEKGETGAIGNKGPVGFPGNDGNRGGDGFPGSAGQSGQVGSPGSIGAPGKDSAYCPCPDRNDSKPKNQGVYGYALQQNPQQQYDQQPGIRPSKRHNQQFGHSFPRVF